MNTHTHAINLQTRAPIEIVSFGTEAAGVAISPSCTVCGMYRGCESDTLTHADARLLAAGFNLLDKTGRALGVDAATLGESVDLVGLITLARRLRELGEGDLPESGFDAGELLLDLARQGERVCPALSTLPALP